ncbi:MAG: hypothetical protein LBR95_00830 [Azoarcus sp.]|nr:hypothetical protein [Azoarcus sp.]
MRGRVELRECDDETVSRCAGEAFIGALHRSVDRLARRLAHFTGVV